MSDPKLEPQVKVDDYCRIVKGSTIPIHGKTDYAMFTNKGQGFGFFEDGDHVVVCDKTSYESVGNEMPANNDGGNPMNLAKWICAKNGDIKIEAPNGTIHLEARNIHIKAIGCEGDASSNGNIILKASNEIELNSKDSLKIKTSSASIDCSLAFDLSTMFFNKISAFETSGTSIDAATGSLTAASASLNSFLNLNI